MNTRLNIWITRRMCYRIVYISHLSIYSTGTLIADNYAENMPALEFILSVYWIYRCKMHGARTKS